MISRRNHTVVVPDVLPMPDLDDRVLLGLINRQSERLHGCEGGVKPWHFGSSTSADRCPLLTDRLESQFMLDNSGNTVQDCHAKDASERRVVEAIERDIELVRTATVAEFVTNLIVLKRAITTDESGVRDIRVGVRRDSRGNRILYPPPSRCLALLGDLHQFLTVTSTDYAPLRATVAYAAIIHAHPFRDGNGRVARAMYNVIMRQCHNGFYLPINSVNSERMACFLIKLRRTIYRGDWAALLGYFTGITCVSLGRGRCKPRCCVVTPRSVHF